MRTGAGHRSGVMMAWWCRGDSGRLAIV